VYNPCEDCDRDPIGVVKEMFVDLLQRSMMKPGQPAGRPVFQKTHGIAYAWFEPLPDLPDDLKVGVFGMGKRPTWLRFSSDITAGNSDLKMNTCGIGLKLFNVPGPKLLGDGDTHDFLFMNFPIFFLDNAKEMCQFAPLEIRDGKPKPFYKEHPQTPVIINAMKKLESTLLAANFWSVIPFGFGRGRYVKYKLEPELVDHSAPPDDANYLAADLARRLREGEARFRFLVQFQRDAESMPLDQATVRWDETLSPPIHVANLVLPRQDITALGQAGYGENLAFNAWHCLAEHEPQGSIAHMRREVYQASADQRRNANGVPTREPSEPRPHNALSSVEDKCIIAAAIYPPIGIARVGNSAEYFVGPEVTEPAAPKHGFYRDGNGALKRQAARFRIYGVNSLGQAVEELNASNAIIKWTVRLENKKAAWYQFQMAMDIPESPSAPPAFLRNPSIADRSSLVIKPGSRSIDASDLGCVQKFDTGCFMGTTVPLGELRVDPYGLLVLGGFGVSKSHDGSPAISFANNELWHDDVSDGPVTAAVHFGGKDLTVFPAWVVVAPPNYGPRRKSVRTMWDLMRDTAISAQMLAPPQRPSFDADIRPIFERMTGLQWVNAGFAAAFGWKSPYDFSSQDMLHRLGRNSPNDRELRKVLANEFRVFSRDSSAQQTWPWIYGDAMNVPPTSSPRGNAALTQTQINMLQQWAAGDFIADYDPNKPPVHCIKHLLVSERPNMLTRAAMEFCLADAFHPGCEMSWPMRIPGIYSAAFRIKQADVTVPEPQHGAALTPSLLTSDILGAQYPGGLTRWLAVPWQTDSASCRSGYQTQYDPYLPTFWPARVPNQVLTAQNYAIVMDTKNPIGERLAAFASRASWFRTLSKSNAINDMIAHYGEMGVVEQRDGPGDPEFPPFMEVESVPTARHAALTLAIREDPSPEDPGHKEKRTRFPHGLL
jgi:hypothetical protein